ncbi:MAG: flavodoxin domain-containing protein [Oscillospiraceae bacterium]|nr:flavodoxin domain-containing protein [Oscillospiraceae bacterium]
MKTLILYATKHGAAREVAGRISKHFGDAVVCDLKQSDIPDPAQFGSIIIGSSIYAGMIRKEAKTFISQNKDMLLSKKLGLFLCGLDKNHGQEVYDANFPPELLQAAKIKSSLGGIYDPKKAGAMGRFIMKIVTKNKEYSDTIDNQKIKQFAEEIQV